MYRVSYVKNGERTFGVMVKRNQIHSEIIKAQTECDSLHSIKIQTSTTTGDLVDVTPILWLV